MKNFYVALALFVTVAAAARAGITPVTTYKNFEIIDESRPGDKVDVAALGKTIEETLAQFETHFWPLGADVKFVVRITTNCLNRPGYSVEKNELLFCGAKKNVIHYGLKATGTIRHEVFHAATCQAFRAKCDKDEGRENEAVNEAFADVFALRLDTDRFDGRVGKNLYRDREQIQNYPNDFCYSLIPNYDSELVRMAHVAGSSLASAILTTGVPLSRIRDYLQTYRSAPKFNGFQAAEFLGLTGTCFTPGGPAAQVAFPGREKNKYPKARVKPGDELKVTVVVNEAYVSEIGSLTMQWTQQREGFPVAIRSEQISPREMVITVRPEFQRGFQKILLGYVDPLGRIRGLEVLYVAVRESREEDPGDDLTH